MTLQNIKKIHVIIYNYYVIKNVNLCILWAPITVFKHEILALCSENFYSFKKSSCDLNFYKFTEELHYVKYVRGAIFCLSFPFSSHVA
jgi:hypothetical protein